jgi:hypothetical protein
MHYGADALLWILGAVAARFWQPLIDLARDCVALRGGCVDRFATETHHETKLILTLRVSEQT